MFSLQCLKKKKKCYCHRQSKPILCTVVQNFLNITCLLAACFNMIFLFFSRILPVSLSPPCLLGSCLSTQQYLFLQSPLMFTDQAQQDVIMVLKFPSNSPVTHVAANTQPGLATPAVITVTANRLFAVNKWHNLPGEWETDRLGTLVSVKMAGRLGASWDPAWGV